MTQVFLIFDSRTMVLLAPKKNTSFGGMDLKCRHTMHIVTLMYSAVFCYILSATIKVLRDFDLLAHFSHHDVFHFPSSCVSKYILL